MRSLKHDPAWIFLLSLGVRLIGIARENFWYDETFTAWISGRLNWADMWQAIKGDTHPPVWYLLERIISDVVGQSELTLRLPAAIFGAAAVVVLYFIAREIFPRRVAQAAALLACFMPAALYYSQDARMYPMLAFFVLLACLGAIKENWILLTAGSIGAVYSQNLGIFYVGVLYLIMLWRAPRSDHKRALIGVIIALLITVFAWQFWGSQALKQAQDISDGFWLQPLTLGGFLWPVASMTMGWRAGDAFILHIYAAALLAALAALGLIWRNRYLVSNRLFIPLAVCFLPPIALAVVSVVWRSVYLPRAMLPSSYLMALLWSYPLMYLSAAPRKALRLLVIPAMGIGIMSNYFTSYARDDLQRFMKPVTDNFQQGDVIYHTGLSTAISIGYYTRGLPYALRPQASDLNQTLSEETKRAMGFPEMAFDDLHRAYRRAWLVVSLNPMSRRDEKEEVERILTTYKVETIYRRMIDYGSQSIYLVRFDNANRRYRRYRSD